MFRAPVSIDGLGTFEAEVSVFTSWRGVYLSPGITLYGLAPLESRRPMADDDEAEIMRQLEAAYRAEVGS